MMRERGNEAPATLDREIRKEVEYPRFMSRELVDEWGDGIPAYAEADPRSPEWRSTPVVSLDLTREGLGEVLVKNEADRASNPTGTIKDRAAWELATLYRDHARALYLKLRVGTLTEDELRAIMIPRLSMITAGNEGRAVAECFARYNLPPPKLILGKDTQQSIVQALERLRADVYLMDLQEKLTTDDIRRASNNENGVSITSVRAIETNSVFYDWQVHEVFAENPDEIYVPYGSGRLMENYLTWQARTMRNESERRPDPRLTVPTSRVISMNVFGAEPKEYPSRADKLSALHKPFLLFDDGDIDALVSLSFTGQETGKFKVSEESIARGHEIFQRYGIEAEPSGAAGLALYADRFEQGLVKQGSKVVVVNTGKGLV